MSSEKIVQELIDFVKKNGRLPKPDEPGLETIIYEAIQEFGSLEFAFAMAGLKSENSEPFFQQKTKKRSKKIKKQTIKPKKKFKLYPKDYFLNLLNLARKKSSYTSPEGTPKWWEKRAGKNYPCSLCNNTIEKTERYIAQKTLTPGRKGIYGYKGTYHTRYYHIICLLKDAENKAKKDIEGLGQKIDSHKRIIINLREEIVAKTDEIKTSREEIEEKNQDYQSSSRWGKISKLLGLKISVRSLNQRIFQLQQRINAIKNLEIPNNSTTIQAILNKKKDWENYLETIEADVKKIQ